VLVDLPHTLNILYYIWYVNEECRPNVVHNLWAAWHGPGEASCR
jgi:hypothetical protein